MSRFRGLEVNAMAAKGVSRRLCMHRVIIIIYINKFVSTENKVEKASKLNHSQAWDLQKTKIKLLLLHTAMV